MKPNFGHRGTRTGGGVFLDAWGAGPMVLRHKGSVWRFEFSEMFGPILLRADFEPMERQPTSEKHPFWEAFTPWNDQGRKCRAIRAKNGRLKFYLCKPILKGEPNA